MIKIENYVGVSPEQMEFIIQGMRNPMNSWEKSDSYVGFDCTACGHIECDGSCKKGDIERENVIIIMDLNLDKMIFLLCKN